MSGRRSRVKGGRYECKTANALKPIYPDARRGIGQTRSGSEVADVEGTPWWIECKRHKRCNVQAAMNQAKDATDGRPPLVVTKDDYKPDLVTMYWADFLKLLERAEGKGNNE